MQFGDDWPGVFIRGDNALWYSMGLSQALQLLRESGAPWMATHAVEQLKGLLGSCVVRPGGAPPEGTQMVPEWGKP